MQDNEIRVLLNDLQNAVTRIERRVEALESLPGRFRRLEVAMVGEDGANGTRADARANASVLANYPPREIWERLIAHEEATAREIGKARGQIDRLQSNIRSGWLGIVGIILVTGFIVSMVAGS